MCEKFRILQLCIGGSKKIHKFIFLPNNINKKLFSEVLWTIETIHINFAIRWCFELTFFVAARFYWKLIKMLATPLIYEMYLPIEACMYQNTLKSGTEATIYK